MYKGKTNIVHVGNEERSQQHSKDRQFFTFILYIRSPRTKKKIAIMSIKYAKDQPAGFTNRIENVAIIGVSLPVSSYL